MKYLIYAVMILGLYFNCAVYAASPKDEAHSDSKKVDKAKKSSAPKKSESVKKSEKHPKSVSTLKPEHSQNTDSLVEPSNTQESTRDASTTPPGETTAPMEASPAVVQEGTTELPTQQQKSIDRPKINLIIKKATYGAAEKVCDATDAVNKLCESQESECIVGAGNGLCGDSAPGVVKELRVTYKCPKQEPKSVTIQENAQVPLTCD
jgi:hypothetical protein